VRFVTEKQKIEEKARKRNMSAHAKKVLDRIDSMKASGKLDGLSLSDFNILQSVMNRWANNENPEFIQGDVADWLGKNGITVKSRGVGFVISEAKANINEGKVWKKVKYGGYTLTVKEMFSKREGQYFIGTVTNTAGEIVGYIQEGSSFFILGQLEKIVDGLNKEKTASKNESLKEASNLPAIAQAAGIVANPKITQVVRQDTIFSTIAEMGLPVKINAMKNVVAEVPDMQTAGAVLQKIYQAFGVKGSFMVTWEGKGKLYFDPKTPIDKAPALAYAKQAGLPPPNFKKLLASVQEQKKSLKETFSKYFGWCEKVIVDNAEVTSCNSPNFSVGSLPPNVIFDMFMGYVSGCFKALGDLGTNITHSKDRRADYATPEFYKMMVDLENVFKTANLSLKKLRAKYQC